MARKRSGSSVQRDHSPIASRRLLPDLLVPPPSLLRAFEDRRSFHPLGDFRPALTFSRKEFSRVSDAATPLSKVPRFRFSRPDKVLVCVRRGVRREVIFAKRKAGKGSRSNRRRRNYYSEVSCAR